MAPTTRISSQSSTTLLCCTDQGRYAEAEPLMMREPQDPDAEWQKRDQLRSTAVGQALNREAEAENITRVSRIAIIKILPRILLTMRRSRARYRCRLRRCRNSFA
jgi:hypothetical protein